MCGGALRVLHPTVKENGDEGKWIVVGYDKRFHSENFSKTAAEVMVANGFLV